MEPGELGGPMQEKLLVLKIGACFLERLTRKEVALRKGRLGIGVLVRVSVIPVVCSGLFRWSVQGGLLRCVGEEEAAGKKGQESSIGEGL